jgi:hypothetical protein
LPKEKHSGGQRKPVLPAVPPPLAGSPRSKTILLAIAGNGRIFQLSMNGKQTFAPFAAGGSALAAILPPLLIGGLAIVALAWLFSDKKKTETPHSGAENGNTGTKPPLPSPVSAFSAPAAPPVPPSVPPVSAASAMFPATGSLPVKRPLPSNGRAITREDLAAVFNGARGLTRTAAVSALKALGFGKTAAYAALSPDGRFSAWLQCAPDGIITWTE